MFITYVTCFYDIGRQTDLEITKYENYFAWIKELLAVSDLNLVFYTTEDIRKKLEYTPRENLIFICDPVLSTYYSIYIEKIRMFWERDIITDNRLKDTAEFACLTNTKFVFLQDTIERNPFKSTHFGWIDAGIAKITPNLYPLSTLNAPDKVRVCIINRPDPSTLFDHDFYRRFHHNVVSGFFTGGAEYMKTFCVLMHLLAKWEITMHNRLSWEMNYMYKIYVGNPYLFDSYYGDYHNAISNYDKCLDEARMPICLAQALMYKDSITVKQIISYILK